MTHPPHPTRQPRVSAWPEQFGHARRAIGLFSRVCGHRGLATAVVSLMLAAGGCSTKTSTGVRADAGGGWEHVQSDSIAAMVPQRVVIHPLTRVVIDADDHARLICMFELKDSFGQSIKALGKARVEMFGRDMEDADAGSATDQAEPTDVAQPIFQDRPERQLLVWEVDLREPQENASHYDDLVMKTYTLNLGGLPTWVGRWARGKTENKVQSPESSVEQSSEPASTEPVQDQPSQAEEDEDEVDASSEEAGGSGPTIVVIFDAVDEHGQIIRLRDTLRVMR